MLIYHIYFSLSDLLHSVWQTAGPSMSLQRAQFRFFLLEPHSELEHFAGFRTGWSHSSPKILPITLWISVIPPTLSVKRRKFGEVIGEQAHTARDLRAGLQPRSAGPQTSVCKNVFFPIRPVCFQISVATDPLLLSKGKSDLRPCNREQMKQGTTLVKRGILLVVSFCVTNHPKRQWA